MAKGALEDIARLKRLQVERREAKSVSIPKPQKLAEAKQAVESVSPKSMANKEVDMANSPTYKYRDKEARKTYQRDLMRKRRAKTVEAEPRSKT
jgi:hypothetical protein